MKACATVSTPFRPRRADLLLKKFAVALSKLSEKTVPVEILPFGILLTTSAPSSTHCLCLVRGNRRRQGLGATIEGFTMPS
jgi:hypothetical protein